MRALHLAADRGHMYATLSPCALRCPSAVVRYLLAEGASVDTRTDRGNTPIHWCAPNLSIARTRGMRAICRMLVHGFLISSCFADPSEVHSGVDTTAPQLSYCSTCCGVCNGPACVSCSLGIARAALMHVPLRCCPLTLCACLFCPAPLVI
jgi:hypothetical protein